MTRLSDSRISHLAHLVIDAVRKGMGSDKRIAASPTVIEQGAAPGGAAPRLVIRGFVMMGGVTIRS